MKEVMAHGSNAAANGGVFVPIICPDTTRFAGCHYQTSRMRRYAKQYLTYHGTADGTHLTNKYRFIIRQQFGALDLWLAVRRRVMAVDRIFFENRYTVTYR